MKYVAGFLLLVLASQLSQAEPEDHADLTTLSRSDLAGEVFERPDVLRTQHPDGHVTLDVTSMISSEKAFSTGMYQSGKTRLEVVEPYGVDEFMYFIKGSLTLTSSDDRVQSVEAGEAVTIPKEWTGIWETEGYTKIWVIYSPGSDE